MFKNLNLNNFTAECFSQTTLCQALDEAIKTNNYELESKVSNNNFIHLEIIKKNDTPSHSYC